MGMEKLERFQRVVKIVDTSNLKIHIKIKTQCLTPNVNYGAHLVFKFCEPRKLSSKLKYVNLKYQMGSETLHAYFATCRDEEWMMIELCRFIPHKRDVDFEVLLESLSRYYCGSGAIYVEGTISYYIVNKNHYIKRVTKHREDGLMEVIVWEFNSSNKLNDEHIPMSLKLRCYEGTMSGLIVYGIEFRPI
ncbi:putative phloem protein [Helianthus anomalus]